VRGDFILGRSWNRGLRAGGARRYMPGTRDIAASYGSILNRLEAWSTGSALGRLLQRGLCLCDPV